MLARWTAATCPYTVAPVTEPSCDETPVNVNWSPTLVDFEASVCASVPLMTAPCGSVCCANAGATLRAPIARAATHRTRDFISLTSLSPRTTSARRQASQVADHAFLVCGSKAEPFVECALSGIRDDRCIDTSDADLAQVLLE